MEIVPSIRVLLEVGQEAGRPGKGSKALALAGGQGKGGRPWPAAAVPREVGGSKRQGVRKGISKWGL